MVSLGVGGVSLLRPSSWDSWRQQSMAATRLLCRAVTGVPAEPFERVDGGSEWISKTNCPE